MRFVAEEQVCFSWDTGGMYTVDIYARVRRAVLVEGKSRCAVAREFAPAGRSHRHRLTASLLAPIGGQEQNNLNPTTFQYADKE
jgi:hypothetical protein